MKDMSRNGVCYALKRSPYYIARNGMVFYFSSVTHLNKFNREVEKKELWLSDSLARRFNVGYVDASLMADFQLYQQVEQRGFYVENTFTCEGYESWDEVEFHGVQVKKSVSVTL